MPLVAHCTLRARPEQAHGGPDGGLTRYNPHPILTRCHDLMRKGLLRGLLLP